MSGVSSLQFGGANLQADESNLTHATRVFCSDLELTQCFNPLPEKT